MRIKDVLCTKGLSGFFSDDKAAILADAEPDGFVYRGRPVTPGFKQIRQPGEALLILLALEDDQVAYGDCCQAQYPGGGGRNPIFYAEAHVGVIEREVKPLLVGRDHVRFRDIAQTVDRLEVDGAPIHTAVRYGVTQALLDAFAKSRRRTMAEIIAEEYGTTVSDQPIRIKAQTGDERYTNVDKMILKRVQVMPHGLINNVKDKLGVDGGLFLDYVKWVRNRVLELRESEDYVPTLHFDVYGTIGRAFGNDFQTITDYLMRVEQAADPFEVELEMPVDMGGKARQIEAFQELRGRLRGRGSQLRLAVDEWCNTIEDIRDFLAADATDCITVKAVDTGSVTNIIDAAMVCRGRGVRAYMAQTANQTDRATQVCANIALATQPYTIGASPGMGLDEGLMIVTNEMQRVLTLCAARRYAGARR